MKAKRLASLAAAALLAGWPRQALAQGLRRVALPEYAAIGAVAPLGPLGPALTAMPQQLIALPPAVVAPALSPSAAAAVVLARAQGSVGLAQVGAAVQSSQDLPSAFAALQRLGVLRAHEADLSSPDGLLNFRYLLERVWYDAAPETSRRFALDRSWPIPALVVSRGGTTYYVHGLFPHPASPVLVPPQQGRVQRLVRALARRGAALYSEQNLPVVYRYGYGRELVDFDFEANAARAFPWLRQPQWSQSPALPEAAKAAWSALTLAVATAWVGVPPDWWGWLVIGAAIVYNYLFWTAFIPLRWLAECLRADALERRGYSEVAASLRRWSRAVFSTRPDADEFRRVALPLPESSYRLTSYGQRARAIANAVLADVGARGLGEVHILTGANHASEIASRLAR